MSQLSPSDEGEHPIPDYTHALLLWKQPEGYNNVLMVQDPSSTHPDQWDLPYFTYPESLNYDSDRFAADLEQLLSPPILPGCRSFTVIAELLGATSSRGQYWKEPIGYERLILVDAQVPCEDIPLSKHVDWKTASFWQRNLTSLDACGRQMRFSRESASKYINSLEDQFVRHTDPRYHFGWFKAAVHSLRSEADRHRDWSQLGRVVQEQVSTSSTLLSLKRSEGAFFLKSPAVGCDEASITSTVADLFPGSIVEVLCRNDKLNCFIMRGFTHRYPRKKHYGQLLKFLGGIQLESVVHLDTLRLAGCEDRHPEHMLEKYEEWVYNISMKHIFRSEFYRMRDLLPLIKNTCHRLREYKIPMTLVHGDFATRNMSLLFDGSDNDSNILLFDWQYACISHPFCDLHEFYEFASEDVLTEYLDLWIDYEPYSRAREALELAKDLGWLLKIWSSFNCHNECNIQRVSSTAEFIIETFYDLESGLQGTLKHAD